MIIVDRCRCVLVMGVVCGVGCAFVVVMLLFAVVGSRLLSFDVIVVCCRLILVGV